MFNWDGNKREQGLLEEGGAEERRVLLQCLLPPSVPLVNPGLQ